MSSTDNTRFNLSRWALEHPALTRYLMVVLMVLGMASYFQLGQDEDPPFNFRAMSVQVFWPGASAHTFQFAPPTLKPSAPQAKAQAAGQAA